MKTGKITTFISLLLLLTSATTALVTPTKAFNTTVPMRRTYINSATNGDVSLFIGGWYTPPEGQAYSTTVPYVDGFNWRTKQWTLSNMTQSRNRPATVAIKDYIIAVGGSFGGRTDGKFSDHFDIFQFDSNGNFNYTSKVDRNYGALMSVAKAGPYAVFFGSPLGAFVVDERKSSLSLEYIGAIIQPRNESCSAVVGPFMIFAGGYSSPGDIPSRSVDIYNWKEKSWISSQQLSVGRWAMATTAVGNRALFVGGLTLNSIPTNAGEIFTVKGSVVEMTSFTLTVPQTGMAAATIGCFSIFGGGLFDNGTFTDTVLLYDHRNQSWISNSLQLSEKRTYAAGQRAGPYSLHFAGYWSSLTDSHVVDAFAIPCNTSADCEDGLFCTTNTCFEGYCLFADPCVNQLFCNSSCDESTRSCSMTDGERCNDKNDPCFQSGTCYRGVCQQDSVCTGLCDECSAGVCSLKPANTTCNDGSQHKCLSNGTCVECLTSSDCLSPCQYCDTVSNQCAPFPQNTPCDDDQYCNGEDYCDGNGVCAHQGRSCGECQTCDETENRCVSKSGCLPLGAKIGLSAGIPVAVLLLAGGIFLYCCVFRKRRHQNNNHDEKPQVYLENMQYLKNIQLEYRIGGGNFGDVYKGIWNQTTAVALKSLKNPEQLYEFEREASLLKKIQHPNIVQYLGIFEAQKGNVYIVTEYLSEGSLSTVLITQRQSLNVKDLVSMAKQAAAGMAFLCQQKIVHRDLALRNLLASAGNGSDKYQVKVSDFGLSRITQDGVYNAKDQRIPFKWTAPEAIAFGTFSAKSDVWSFGVVLWEIFSYGEQPYSTMTNAEAVEKVKSGYRMPQPENCPKEVYQLMLHCWKEAPDDRPSFESIFLSLKEVAVVYQITSVSPSNMDHNVSNMYTVDEEVNNNGYHV